MHRPSKSLAVESTTNHPDITPQRVVPLSPCTATEHPLGEGESDEGDEEGDSTDSGRDDAVDDVATAPSDVGPLPATETGRNVTDDSYSDEDFDEGEQQEQEYSEYQEEDEDEQLAEDEDSDAF